MNEYNERIDYETHYGERLTELHPDLDELHARLKHTFLYTAYCYEYDIETLEEAAIENETFDAVELFDLLLTGDADSRDIWDSVLESWAGEER